jgi:hypothetical protein
MNNWILTIITTISYYNANSTIPNDQGVFAEFCYGSMNSCKSGNIFACAKQTSTQQNNLGL